MLVFEVYTDTFVLYKEYFHNKLDINLNDKVKKLNVSQKQKVEILKLLFLDSEILILMNQQPYFQKVKLLNF